MQWIKIPLVLVALAVLVVFFRNRANVGMRAGARLGALLLAAIAIASIINPNIPQHVADWVGVTRGTDLLLYLLIVVFAFTTLGFYFRLRETNHRLQILARSIAIETALTRGGPADATVPGPDDPERSD